MSLGSLIEEQEIKEYDPFHGMYLYFDFVAKILSFFKKIRIVYQVANSGETIIDPVYLCTADGKLESDFSEYNTFIIKKSNLFKGIP